MTVYLVGAGPGHPDLITVRGAEVLGRADVVLFDRLVSRDLLDLAPPRATRIDVGKRPGETSARRQSELNELLIHHGRRSQTVVRLKGGDPFVFGRGGEEAAALLEAGIEFEIVPGVTSAFAAPAAAGVPVTHRGLARSVTVVTGHVDDDKTPWGQQADHVDWDALAISGATLVIMMGMQNRAEIARRLVSAGRAPDTPVIVVQDGTTSRQRSVRCTLETLEGVELGPPAIIVVGEVAGLDLGSVPTGSVPTGSVPAGSLSGISVVVTRPTDRSDSLVSALAVAGARVVVLPVVTFAEPADGGTALRAGVLRAQEGRYAWIAFTSAHAVERFVAQMTGPLRPSTRVAAVGRATQAALRAHGLGTDVVPTRFSAEGLARALASVDGDSGRDERRVLFARSDIGREVLASELRDRGWEVEEIEAYRTVAADVSSGITEEALRSASQADVVTFASPSSVQFYVQLTAGRRLPRVVACIGPTTAEAARSFGLRPDVVAHEPSGDGLVRAIWQYLRTASSG